MPLNFCQSLLMSSSMCDTTPPMFKCRLGAHWPSFIQRQAQGGPPHPAALTHLLLPTNSKQTLCLYNPPNPTPQTPPHPHAALHFTSRPDPQLGESQTKRPSVNGSRRFFSPNKDLQAEYLRERKTLRCGVTLLMYGCSSKVSRLLGDAWRMWTSSKSLGKSEAGFIRGTMCHARSVSLALLKALLMYRLRALAEKYPVNVTMYSEETQTAQMFTINQKRNNITKQVISMISNIVK